ncbi:MAG: SDR family NAD(P)-dependent oxidoreductase, partial [Ginsengibacter sp.]
TGTVRHGSSDVGDSHEKYKEVKLDLLSSEQCQEFTENFFKKHGEIQVAVLTAGGFAMANIAATTTSDIHKQYQLNFETTYNMVRPIFLQMMKQKSGRIFLIGSRAGLDVSKAKGVTAYALSKSLIFRLAELMNAEAEGTDVVVSVIVPSTIDTPENRIGMPDADFTTWVTPQQIADVIYFYSSQAANAIRQPVIKVYNKS